MLQSKVISNVPLNCETPVEGINDKGTMAICWGKDDQTIYGRGLLPSGASCIFQGRLREHDLSVEKAIISPTEDRQTGEGKIILGYEDPTFISGGDNFVESGKSGVLCTEAYYKQGRSGPVGANLLYIGEGGLVQTVLTPAQVEARLVGADYGPVDMVKEPAVVVDRTGTKFLSLELAARSVSGRGQSRIAIAELGVMSAVKPFLEPTPGTWFDNHTSTVARGLPLRDGLSLYVFNGAKLCLDEGKRTNVWSVGLAVLNPDCEIIWISDAPIITPPEGVTPGPGGQLIAFGSDARIKRIDHSKWHIAIQYHAMDRYPCLFEADLSLL